MAVWQYDLTMIPTGNLPVKTICEELNSLLPELDSWSKQLRIWGAMDGNRVDMFEDSDGVFFRIRIDLREPSIPFMRKILALACRWQLTMEDENGIQLQMSLEALVSALKCSSAHRFVTDPVKYLSDLETEMTDR